MIRLSSSVGPWWDQKTNVMGMYPTPVMTRRKSAAFIAVHQHADHPGGNGSPGAPDSNRDPVDILNHYFDPGVAS